MYYNGLPGAKPRNKDSHFWLEFRGETPGRVVWCRCCDIEVARRGPPPDLEWPSWLVIDEHFETRQHRDNYSLAQLAGETA